jgi:hypothetical protein
VAALSRFLLRVLLWLPVCFGAWYFLSVLFTLPLALMVDALMGWVFPNLVEGVTQKGNELTVVTRAVVSVHAGSGARTGDILFELNPLKYGYSVPLYTALVLAVPGEDSHKTLRWLVGMLILLAVQVFGVATEILKVLALDLGEEGRELLGFPAWGYEGVVLAYQLGFLILPPVAPIAIWFGQFQDVLNSLTGEAGWTKGQRGPPFRSQRRKP